ncbi:hypothetical protein D3C80_1736580 [compost metagenome]
MLQLGYIWCLAQWVTAQIELFKFAQLAEIKDIRRSQPDSIGLQIQPPEFGHLLECRRQPVQAVVTKVQPAGCAEMAQKAVRDL